MTIGLKREISAGGIRLALTIVVLAASLFYGGTAIANKIAIVVNDRVITTLDLQRRSKLLQLQRQKGNLKEKAKEQMIEQALKLSEADRLGYSASDTQVNAAFTRFAKGNKMSDKQMEKALDQSGVGADHFKEFIKTQMTWPKLVEARFATSGGRMSTEELVKNMLERGGEKPTTTEYILQQVIFVVPQSKRSAILNRRKKEASSMRSRFVGCDSSHEFAKGLLDVSVRDLGRIMQPELPKNWKTAVEKTPEGGTTPVQVTEQGVEFLAVCRARQVSDDLAAEMVFRSEKQDSDESNANSEKFLKELQEKARISYH
ncbi:peptidylprolyl isomerase [Hoeflea sp. CAU 1731]